MSAASRAAEQSLLRRLRLRRDQTQANLAEKADMSAAYLSEVERGLKNPSRATIKKLIGALGLTEDQAEALRAEFEPGSSGAAVAIDKIEQEELGPGSQVWIISRQPAELADAAYREVVIRNLAKGVKYTYWIDNSHKYEELRDTVHLLSDERKVPIEGVQVPPEVNWFSMIIYNPLEDGEAVGYQALRQEGGRVSEVRKIHSNNLDRILYDLRSIYQTVSGPKHPKIRGYTWL